MLQFDIITVFPRIFDSYVNESIIKRAQKKKLIKINVHALRDYAADKRKKVDDKPYGGGPGMVLRIEPLAKAVQFAESPPKADPPRAKKIILFTPAGKRFDNTMAAQFAKNYERLILVAGHYEGVDERIKKIFNVQEVSVGPYVLTGGELPAMVVIDAVSRHVKGVLGKEESLEETRFGVGVPAYTRPEVFVWKGKKYRVPKVLLSGNHKKIEEWRLKHRKTLSHNFCNL